MHARLMSQTTFMERLQNNILGNTALAGADVFERRGFLAAPDER